MRHTANTNVSFDFLKNSSEFLDLVLNNINSCVLLLDKEMRLVAFNDAIRTIFPKNNDEDIRLQRCGEAIGCAHQLEEAKECGKTSQCHNCDLRLAALNSYMKNEVVYKKQITKPFFNYEGQKVDKHLQFSTRLFKYEDERYIIMLVEDITELVNQKQINNTQPQ